MASIYSNAYLTIAATGANSCDVGCLNTRDQTTRVDIAEVTGVKSTVYVRKKLGHGEFDWANAQGFEEATRGNVFSYKDPFPLFQRGWCFQERLLSGRIIHYTDEEMVWECSGMTSCECGTMDRFAWTAMLRDRRYAAGISADVEVQCGKLDRARSLSRQLVLPDYVPGTLPAAARQDAALMFVALGRKIEPELLGPVGRSLDPGWRWLDLVYQYSQRKLTYHTDALPALSGLAQRWSSTSSSLGRYLAGIWEADILRGLMWKAIDWVFDENRFWQRSDFPKAARPEKYYCPTWSWACVRRPVAFITPGTKAIYRVTILQAECIPSGTNNYGEVSSGFIRLRGKLARRNDSMRWGQTESSTKRIILRNELQEAFFSDDPIECQMPKSPRVFILWVCTDVMNVQTMQGFERCLVLRECEEKPGVFIRLGIIEYVQHAELIQELEGEDFPKTEITII